LTPFALEIAGGVETAQEGRIYIERFNAPFLAAGGGDDFRAGIEPAIALGWLWLHESGTYDEVHGQRRGPVCLTYVKAPAKPRRSFLMGHSPLSVAPHQPLPRDGAVPSASSRW
jgi:hypothetical protein